MLFKVAFINTVIDSNIPIKSRSAALKSIIMAETLNNFYCFKIQNEHNYSKQGIVKNDDTMVAAQQFIRINDGRTLITLGFILVNRVNNRIYYYGCSNKTFSEIMKAVFLLTNYDINYQVDSNKLERIERLTIEAKREEQINYFYDEINLSQSTNIEKELDIMDSPSKVSIIYEYKKGGIFFNSQKLKDVKNKYNDLSIKGFDNKNNPIFIKDIVQLCIDIGLDDSTYEKIDNLKFNEIMVSIINKEEGTLNEY